MQLQEDAGNSFQCRDSWTPEERVALQLRRREKAESTVIALSSQRLIVISLIATEINKSPR